MYLDVQLSLVKGGTIGLADLSAPVILQVQIEQIKKSPSGKLFGQQEYMRTLLMSINQ